MKTLLLALLFSLPAVAKDKQTYQYQDGTLIDFKTISTGQSCSGSGSTNGTVDDSGTVKATTSSSADCTNTTARLYTVAIGNHTYVIKPTPTKGEAAKGMATLGWSYVFAKPSVLANALPGAHFKVRTDESGLYVFDGKRESHFSIVEAK